MSIFAPSENEEPKALPDGRRKKYSVRRKEGYRLDFEKQEEKKNRTDAGLKGAIREEKTYRLKQRLRILLELPVTDEQTAAVSSGKEPQHGQN